MTGVFFPQQFKALLILGVHTSSTLLLTASSILWFGQKSWGNETVEPASTNTSPTIEPNQTQRIEPAPTPFTPQSPITIPVVPFELQDTPQPFRVNPQFRPYRLGPGDVLAISVPRFPELSVQAAVGPEGNIVLPLVGNVSVRGLTLEEATEKIRSGYNQFVIDPVVTVGLAAQRPVQISVTGEVARPGLYALGLLPRVPTALLTAGGTTTQADLRQVLIRRFLVDGSFIEQKVDLFTPLAAGEPIPDLRLEDGDAVIVPKLQVGTLQNYNRQLVANSNLVQPTISIRVLSYPNQALGNINVPTGSSFLDAFTAAGVSLVGTDLDSVAVIRFDPERGRAIVRELNARRALFGDASQNILLQDNDVIVIGRNLVGRITYALNIFTQPFRDILGFLLFFQELTDNATNLFRPGGNNGN
ncbi:polysaccharide biosynthesis/export family protein [Aerosakkonemataceae cyanobacterium BLCC-F154]|uniref:Polysaccharide biosynthesis/export family protein n=1 Tax=Floridaenema fluviatile BLCC-F154 TaxID=3153640 RepID=A0ABV4YBK7_9CYAN